ncbi:phage protein [Streptococcus pneumoniae]|nr:phage protein [Streptococcus pneumoniae]
MNKQELIKKLEERRTITGNFQGYVVWWKDVKEIFEQLGEPQPVKVPQCVADWIDYFKKNGDWDLFQAMDYLFGKKEIREWLEYKNNQDLFARAWLDGYEVEKEKRYLVTLKNRQPLVKSQSGSTLYFSQDITARNYKGTQKELEDAKFGWVFDCPGIEIEEVK